MTIKRTTLSRSVALAFGAAALMFSVSSTVVAQTSATGRIFGDVTGGAGTTVVIEQAGTGVRRTLTPNAAGRFDATALNPGTYTVQLVRGGSVVQTKEIEVFIGQGSEVNFAAAETLQTVQVVSRRATIDVSSANSGTTFTAQELEKLPVAKDVAAVLQLVPGTTRGDTRYGGLNAPSFGGASAAENAYHINGFPVTNILYGVSFSQLPFNSIAQTQVLAGGYGAEFGRSTGGVINITTKRGTNTWEAGASLKYSPKGLRSDQKNSVYPTNGSTRDGQVFFAFEDDRAESYGGNFYVGGPIIKDKLFFYYTAEENVSNFDVIRQTRSSANSTTGIASAGFQEIKRQQPRSLLKLDWNITQDHIVEYTNIHDKNQEDRKYYGYNYGTLARNDNRNGGIRYENSGPTPVAAPQGADTEIFKYTGYWTDNLTFTGVYGWSRTRHSQLPDGYNPSLFQVFFDPNSSAPGFTYFNPQPTTGSLLVSGAQDKSTAYRMDLEYKLPWQLAGTHTVRGGLDRVVYKSKAGNALAGGGRWEYGRQANPGDSPWGPPILAPNTVAQPLAQQGYFVDRVLIDAVSTPSVIQKAQYIEDRWQVTKDVLLTIGIRDEQFDNRNGDNATYLKQDRQIAPRFAAAWDVNGNSTFKVFGTAGRYHLPLPTNVAVRGAGSSRFTTEFFTYTGVDPVTAAPTGLTSLGPVVSANNEFGQAIDPLTVSAVDIKSHYQDEFTLGFEKALTRDYNFGVRGTYRNLKSTIDDMCDDRPFRVWAAAQPVPIDTSNWGGGCFLFNPGVDNRFRVDLNGDGVLEDVSLSAGALGYPKAKRKYQALDFFLEHPFRDKWYGKINYTYSKSKGNTEGLLLSDIGQADVSTTQVFDYPEIMQNSYGYLPNDRRHQIKAYGFYEFTPQWGAGVNFLAASGRPKNCLGNFTDNTNDAYAYGPAFFYCNGVATPRGSQGRLPWDIRFDVNVAYRPDWFKGLMFKMDIFNVFNRRVEEAIEERYHIRPQTTVRPEFGAPLAYSTPRYVQFLVQYDHKF